MGLDWRGEYRRRRVEARQALLARRERIFASDPAFAAWQIRFARAQRGLAEATLRGGDEEAAPWQARIEELEAEKRNMLRRAGEGSEALDLHYHCPKCRDYGMVEGRECDCVAAYRREWEMDSEGERAFREQCFARFDADVFPEENGQRRRMLRLRDKAEAYAEVFPKNTPPGLFLTGGVGLGKSFILHCIGGRVRERGYRVRKTTGYQFHQMLMGEYFAGNRTGFQEMLDADLLLFDDLGTEPRTHNNTSESYFFAVLDERTMRGKPMVVATNFSLEEIDRFYGERCSSRLLDGRSFETLGLRGEDLRQRRD